MTKSTKKTKTKAKPKTVAKAKPKSKLAAVTKPKITTKIVKKNTPMAAALAAVENHVEPKKKTKIQILIDLLNNPDGTSIEQMMAATGWQKHTVRAAMSRELSKKRGLFITSGKPKGEARTYTIDNPDDYQ